MNTREYNKDYYSKNKLKWKQYYKLNSKQKIRNSKNWRVKNPEKVKKITRAYELKTSYGLSIEDYDKLFDLQLGKCKICGNVGERYKLNVDHDHTTGKVRGLLCKPCNLGLGYAKDNVCILKSMINYLQAG
jgi:hypothetical protein